MATSPNRRSRHSPTRPKAAGSAGHDPRISLHLSSKRKNSLRRRIRNVFIGIVVSAVLIACLRGYFSGDALGYMQYSPQAQFVDWYDRREEVRDAFLTSWNAYKKHAWGNDVFHPMSKRGENMSPKGLGWIIVDSLDTMMLMNLTQPLADARRWLHRSLTWDQDQDVNTFETTIRMLGGLLSAHYLSTQLPHAASKRDSVYLSKAIDLADRLLVAFDSNSGIPFASVNIGKREGIASHADGGASSTAEAATVQLEMKYLSHLTGNDVYWKKAERVMKVLDDQKMEGGLLPIFVHPSHGQFTTREIRLGSRGDSYYEYLAKQYLQTGERIYRDMWDDALGGIARHLVTTTLNAALKFVAELPTGVGGPLSPKMDHLVCFLPGTIAMAATEGRPLAEARRDPGWTAQHEDDIELSIEIMNTCWGMYVVTETGLAPEITWFNATEADLQPGPGDRWLRKESSVLSRWKKDFIIKPLDAHNLQRPETVESLFMMYRITGNAMYREWGWKIFQSFQKHTLVPDGEGYTSMNDVRTVPASTRDNMESFWLAETLKYLYLLFSPTDYMPLTEVVFNTEAHPFPRFTPRSSLKTGWERLPR
ncbi:glycosyl hydrolase family 47 [Colletotrichum paranaense]|uniref:alpha-1,2-Mannosidase n=1 Tax=Colletotrichum paranaense TaxID=1914294 RepID=A0ABQ9SD97_9PEZI|nr:glycosyl hydrolase family 47 [Colletotrichum paranaense]KAK1533468.1 glycosyl hydrolase family 47 [Colletotrichum paranaense]